MDFDPNNPYDKLFYRLSEFANTFIADCKLYVNTKNIFLFIKFKFHERKARYCSKYQKILNKSITHLCSSEERINLLDEIAKKCNMKPDEIQQLYDEYYSGRKHESNNN